MHILLIHQSFTALDEPGGTRHHELARYLAQRGHDVTVIASPVSYLTGSVSKRDVSEKGGTGENQGRVDAEGEVRILRAYTYGALHKSFVHRLIAFFSFMISSFITGLRVGQVDLVWGTSPPIFQGVTAWAVAGLRGVPFLFEVRDLWPAFAVAVGVLRQPLLIAASEWLEGFLYRRADRVMVNSPGFIDHVWKRGARRVELIPNGADAGMFDPEEDGATFRRNHGLEGKFLVLYAGAHGFSNDLGVLLEAASLLRSQKDIAFVFVGDGKEKPALVERANSMGLDNVCFILPLPKLEMPDALAAAGACIAILKPVPLYKTVYPNKVFDYMAAGRPVVLAIGGAIKEVIMGAGAGIAVTPGDSHELAEAIRQLARDPVMGKEMGRKGRACVISTFDRPVIADKLATMLENMVSKAV